MFSKKGLATLFALLLVTLPVFADDFGRDSKGAPFRIDSAGNQLSDYIAELEVTNKELRSQIFSLEGRVKNPSQANVGNAQMACPQIPNQSEVQKLKEQYDNQIKISQDQLTKNFGEINLLREERKSLELNLNNAVTEIESLRKGTGDREVKATSAVENLQSQLAKCNSIQNQAFNDADGKMAALKMEREKLAEQNRDLNQQLSAINMQLAEALNVKEQNSKVAQLPVPVKLPETKRASMSSETTTRTIAVQTPIKVQLATINSLVGERKNLLDSVKAHSKGVMISLQTLASDNGTSLDTFRVMANNNELFDDVISGLSQIERKLNEDINTLRRLNKI